MTSRRTSGIADDIASVLENMHADLETQNSLETLAQRAGYSPFHFHRSFVAVVGESPKQHLLRMRIERAAYLIAITDRKFVEIAFDVGFQTHESFTRAFRRRFEMSPTEYRAHAKSAQAERMKRNEHFTGHGCVLSAVRFLTLRPATLLCSRHLGAYAEVGMPPFGADDELWSPLIEQASGAGVEHDGTAWSICHDNPTITPGPQQRLDACIGLDRPVPDSGKFRNLDFAGGLYAGIEHTGPHRTIAQAYAQVADAIRRSTAMTFATGPLVQIFRHIDTTGDEHRTEVYFPIIRS